MSSNESESTNPMQNETVGSSRASFSLGDFKTKNPDLEKWKRGGLEKTDSPSKKASDVHPSGAESEKHLDEAIGDVIDSGEA